MVPAVRSQGGAACRAEDVAPALRDWPPASLEGEEVSAAMLRACRVRKALELPS